MGRFAKVLVVVLLVLVVGLAIAGWYVMQYQRLQVDADAARSGSRFVTIDTVELNLVLRLENTGSVDLYVPPTTFDVYVDGVFAGPGKADPVTVPAGGMAWTTATITVDAASGPQAYAALVDPGEDTITLVGEAHVDLGPLTFDFPFDESFKMQV